MKRFVNMFLLPLIILSMAISALGTTPARAAANLPPVEGLLNPDGSLNLSTGYAGSLDIGNYEMKLDPQRGPVFTPSNSLIPNTWTSLITGLNNYVYSIAVSGTDVYVGGQFTDAGGNPDADYIAKWDGSTWSALGATPLNGQVQDIAVSGTDVYVGGWFTDAGNDLNADYLAKWNGSSWSAVGGTAFNGAIYAIVASGTDLYVGGFFTNIGTRIAKWDGSTWSNMSISTSSVSFVVGIAVSGTDLYAIGDFDYIAKWDGSNWSVLGNTHFDQQVRSIAVSGANVYAGGLFSNAGGNPDADYIAMWNGSSWSALGATPFNSNVEYNNSIVIHGTDVYVAGFFENAGGDPNADYIAKWDGSAWSAVGDTSSYWSSTSLAMSSTGDLYAGGTFVAGYGAPDSVAPTVDAFTATTPTSNLNIPITSYTASDNIAVTGYMITESGTAPAAGDAGWSATLPTVYAVGSAGSYTLYPWAKDAAGNVSAVFGSPLAVVVDTTGPTVSMSSATSNSTNASPIAVTVTFNESVTGFTSGDITASNGSVSNFAGSGASYSFDLTPTAGGLVTADIAGSVAQDSAGNNNSAAMQFTRTYDSIAPTVSMSSATSNPTNASPIAVTVTFSKSVTGFTSGDIMASNGSVSNFAGSGASYSFDLTPTTNGLVTADIAGSVAQDSAGNNNSAAAQFTRTYDNSAPIVSLFIASSPSSAVVAITAFSASDNVAVAGYKITESSTPPLAGASGWTGTAPATYTLAGIGAYVLYPWVKDTSGNVSAVFGSPRSVVVTNTQPFDESFLTTRRPRFAWDPSEFFGSPIGYTIQVSLSDAFTSPITYNVGAVNNFTPTADLAAKKIYYWRINAKYSSVVFGPWSPTLSFTTGNPPTIPTLVAPVNNVLIVQNAAGFYVPLLDWSNSALPAPTDSTIFENYEVLIDDDPAFSSPLSIVVAGIANSKYQVVPGDALLPNTIYYWKTLSYNNVDGARHYSSSLARVFRTSVSKPAPILPANAAVPALTTKRPTFTWSSELNATSYNIQLSITPITSATGTPTYKNVAAPFTPPVDLTGNKLYYWRAQSNGVNGPSAWSQVFTFTTGVSPSTPNPLAPLNSDLVSSLTPKLDWSTSTVTAPAIFSYYEVQVSTSPAFDLLVVNNTSITNIASSELTTPALTPDTKYYWRVRAVGTTPSAWSAIRYFRTRLAAPILVAPANSVSGVSKAAGLIFNWDDALPVTGSVTGYNLQISTSATFAAGSVPVNVWISGSGNSNYVTMISLLPNKTYYWRVRATGLNTSDWAVRSFTTGP